MAPLVTVAEFTGTPGEEVQMKRIPPFQLSPIPLNEAARVLPPFKRAGDEVGKRHKLGGQPDLLQPDLWPLCPSCHAQMSFYGQLDSINDEFCLADCGIVCVFVCFDCNETVSLIQTT
jgi:hypothetical protein